MAKQPGERYPSAGNLGEAALVAAGGQKRAKAEMSVATGDAAPFMGVALGTPAAEPDAPGAPAEPSEGEAEPPPGNALRWGVALAVLALLAVCMVAALNALSTL